MDKKMIIQLPEELANLISAGEVVERPLSVVKELVENSIDADGNNIKIDLVESGLKKITVSDNGYGMSKEEIPLALKRHATSKIATSTDLFHISSLGFRGEALPSIASVSNFRITSCTNGLDGYSYYYKAGKLIEQGPTPSVKGTKIEVENLFFNTPARFNHLSGSYQELAQITNFLNRLVIAHPHIAFTLINNGKTILQTDGKSNIEVIISETYGKEVARNIRYFENENNFYKISGYTTTNSVYRSNRNAINLIVNGRVIRNQSLIYAITDAYKTILPVGKYPVTILEITTDPGLVDVNVHPSKLEIRFTDEYNLKVLITNTIKDTLLRRELIVEPISTPTRAKIETPITAPEIEKVEEVSTQSLWEMFDEEPPIVKEEIKLPTYTPPRVKEEVEYSEVTFSLKEENSFFKNLSYCGQYLKTYLLMENEENLYLIDQHAAMERCMYEKITKKLSEPNSEKYELLVPINIDFSISEIPLITKKLLDLKAMGIDAEPFGGTTITFRAIPLWIPKGLEVEFLRDIVNHLVNDQMTSKSRMYDSLAKTLSCKKSIKGNTFITDLEVTELMKNLDNCQMPYTCPHGRPTIIKFTKYEIEKMFKRVM